MIYALSSTSQSIDVQVVDDSGLAVTGLVAATFPALTYSLAGANADVAFPALSDLAALTTAWVAGGVKERGGGVYRVDAPDALFATAGVVAVRGEASGKHALAPRIDVGAPQTGDSYARLGAPAGASIAADLAEIAAETDDVAAIKAKTDLLTVTTVTYVTSGSTGGSKTVETAAGSYLSATEALKRCDWRVFADLCSDTGTRIADASTLAANANFLALLLDASGVVEQAAMRSKRYSVADLLALTGAGQAGLYRLILRIAVVLAHERRPDREMKQPWIYEECRKDLTALSMGETVFPFLESEEAGLPHSTTETATDVEARRGTSLISERFLGRRGNRRGP